MYRCLKEAPTSLTCVQGWTELRQTLVNLSVQTLGWLEEPEKVRWVAGAGGGGGGVL